MNSLLLFIPLAICLVIAIGGLACVILAAVGLKKTRTSQPRQSSQASEPPLLTGARQPGAAAYGFWTLCLKVLLTIGVGGLVSG